MKTKSKALAISLCAILLVIASVMGTMAYLTSTDEVTNTFTYGNIGIELKEHEYDNETNSLNDENETTQNDNYKIIPGVNLPKDPFVRFTTNSEPCYLFVKVTGEFLDKVTYKVDDSAGWQQLEDKDGNSIAGVYYMKKDSETPAGTIINILKDQIITVSSDLTKEDVTKKDNDGNFIKNEEGYYETIDGVTLEFTAYAIQQEGFKTAEAAWAEVSKTK